MYVGRTGFLCWVYYQSSGRLALCDGEDGLTAIARGYSGAIGHQNRTESESLVAKGPIPRGLWRMDPPVASHARLGPVAIPLEPAEPKTALKRSGFFVHGDNNQQDFSASSGCIVLDRPTRELMRDLYWSFNVRSIVVE